MRILRREHEKIKGTFGKYVTHVMGIHTGQALAANIGGFDRLSYALIGDSVNVASRIQELNQEFMTDILITESTKLAIGQTF